MSNAPIAVLMRAGALVFVGVAAVHGLGWEEGLGVLAAVWLIMPYVKP